MTIPVSTAPAAKVFLVAAITAQIADPDVSVLYDSPGPFVEKDVIAVGRVMRDMRISHMVGSGGTGWIDEDYSIEIQVAVFRGGDDAAAVDARAWQLIAAVETTIRNDPSLGGLVIVAHPARSATDGTWENSHKGRLVDASIEVRIQARI